MSLKGCDTKFIKGAFTQPFTHAFTALRCVFFITYLGLLISLMSMGKKVITSKTQCTAENAWGNWMWQLGLNYVYKNGLQYLPLF